MGKFWTICLMLFYITASSYGIDFYPDKARYLPGDEVRFICTLPLDTHQYPSQIKIRITPPLESPAWEFSTTLAYGSDTVIIVSWLSPLQDFQGYLAELHLQDNLGNTQTRTTGIDISSDWKKFPRYGFLAHFNKGIDTRVWINELNKYHLNGLQFYDFQYKHHQPLAGTVASPQYEWKDIAGREISGKTIQEFIQNAHNKNMMAFAYNASYATYADAFQDHSGVSLTWGAWSDPTSQRIESTLKSYGPFPESWSTPRLLFMNQNHPDWQRYIFSQMSTLFAIYPFDGWHIDTYGDRGAYDYMGEPIDYIGGFQSFTNKAKSFLNKRILFNTVAGAGQQSIANSQADFVYSELWENHGTYLDILRAADEIHAANQEMGIVFPAYLHKPLSNQMKPGTVRFFNPASVLLADAVMFASGASHLELGDDLRMLSTEYFPDTGKLVMSSELRESLRTYYDFLVIYQTILRDHCIPAKISVHSDTVKMDKANKTGKVWYFAREKNNLKILHFINLTGLTQNKWRDDQADYPEVPLLSNFNIKFSSSHPVTQIFLATPDFNQGRPLSLKFHQHQIRKGHYQIICTIPQLKYWDVLIIK